MCLRKHTIIEPVLAYLAKNLGCCLDFKVAEVSDLFRPFYLVEKPPLVS